MPSYRRRGRRLPSSLGSSITPTLSLSSSTVTLAATTDDTATVQAVITARSGNGGTLGGVGIGTIVEDNGSGWLSATVQAGFPALVTVVCDPTGLTADTYTGTVPVNDPQASNSPRNITVTFTVSAGVAAPTIALSPTSVALSVQQGNAATATANVLITSGTAGVLAGPTVGTITGTASSGVTAAITGIGPSYTLAVTAASAALTSAGSPYSATVPVLDADASNSPQNVTVNLTVTAVSPPATPTILLSTSAVSLTAVEGSGVTRTTTVTVSSGNGAALGTTSVGTITGTGASAITTSVSGHVVTINAAVGALAAAVYTLTVPIQDSLASNSPQNVTVTFTVTASNAPTTSVPSAINLFGSTAGTVLVVGAYPLRPGDLTAADVTARKFAIFVNGVEQSCYVQALPGIHADGTSLRAVGYQFYYDIPNSTPITAEVRFGTARTTTDLNKVTLTPQMLFVPQPAQTWGVDAEPTAKLLPTDLQYLCATDVTFEPLQPASMDDPVSIARSTYFDQRVTATDALTDVTRDANGVRLFTATYESARALIASWCRTGNTTHLRQALKQGYRLLEYTTVTPSASRPNPSNNVFAESRMVSTDSQIKEEYSMRFIGYAACWQISWYAPFFACVNAQHMNHNYAGRATVAGANLINNVSTGGYINSVYSARFNLQRSFIHLIAYAIGANRRQTTQSGFGNRDMNFVNELPLILGAFINSAYTKGDYRDGLTGLYQNSTDGQTFGGIGPGSTANFQLNFVNAFYMFYEREVYADSRIPALIKTNTDVMLANSEPLVPASRGYGYTDSGYGTTYFANPTPAQGTAQADYLAYATGSLAYCAARYPNTVSNGATYETWYQRAADPKNIGNTGGTLGGEWPFFARAWKILGDAYGFSMAAPYHIAQGVPAGASAIHSVPVPTQWPV